VTFACLNVSWVVPRRNSFVPDMDEGIFVLQVIAILEAIISLKVSSWLLKIKLYMMRKEWLLQKRK
jgi:hypothetical protein